jgi:putative thioredoxin
MSTEISDFQTDVLERSKTIPVLVDFWAEWCGPCRMLTPVLERLAEKHAGRWVLAKVNSDIHQDIAARYGVRGIPNVKLFIDGSVTDEFTGALPERAIETWLEKALPNPFRKELSSAEELIKAEDVEGARSLLERLLKSDPSNDDARVLLAGTYLPEDPERSKALVEGIEEDSPHYPFADALRTISALRRKENLPPGPSRGEYLLGIQELSKNNFDGALEHFIEVIRQDRSFDDDGARKAVIAIFRILGEDHEITRRHRRSFSSALYS